MNWVRELYDLYEKNEKIAGLMEPEQPVLLPPYHTTAAAQIAVTVDQEGNFLYGEIVPDKERMTIIPATDKSAARTTGIEPHPLCDNLKYLAGDYAVYVSGKDFRENHRQYMEQLEKWVESPYSHPKATAIYAYLRKNRIMRDLAECGVLAVAENGMADEKKKIQNIDQTEAFVRFRVETNSISGEEMWTDRSGALYPECWKDRSLQECYIRYCRAAKDNVGISYLTGKKEQLSYLQPKKICNEGDRAKLISSNDGTNFTFRGRFRNKEEAFAIGYEDSQKIHNALKWILRKQGVSCGGMYFVTWESDSGKIFDWLSGTDEICREAEENGWIQNGEGLDSEEDLLELEPDEPDGEEYTGTGEADAARFRMALKGYERRLDASSRTLIMALDAAVPGRLALMEFKDYQSSRYLESLKTWFERCSWRHGRAGKKGRYYFTGMVSVRDAAELLYGVEQNGFFSMKGKEKLYKETAKRWMPCILEGKEIPQDMVNLAVQRASSPMSFDSRFLWERVLSFACSLIKQQYKARYKEEWTMALDEKCSDRNYLYGRLLAVADRIEYRTFEKEDGRQTNAKRYMSAFSRRPFPTWKILEEKLIPYLSQLKGPERMKYQKLLDEICDRFSPDDFSSDEALSGLYLLGFHNQSYALKNIKENEEEDNE